MRICIFGAGAIGGMIGSLLKYNNIDVTLIAMGEHYNEIKKNGLVFKSKEYNLDICQKFDVYQDISDIGKFDLVINGLKAHSANNTAKHVSQLLHESSVILPTFKFLILSFSNNNGGLDFKIFSLAFSEIPVFKSNNVTGIFALHK